MANIYWSSDVSDKVYKIADFVSTVLDSVAVSVTNLNGCAWDGNSLYVNDSGGKFKKTIGFTSTISDSFSHSAETPSEDFHRSAVDDLFAADGTTDDKAFRYTGFTSTLVGSFSLAAADTEVVGCAWDGTNYLALGAFNTKIFKFTGFTTTILDSYAAGIGVSLDSAITWDGTNVQAGTATVDKLYKYTGFTSTIADSFAYHDAGQDITGMAHDEAVVPQPIITGDVEWLGNNNDKLYKTAGFGSTIIASFAVAALASNGSGNDGTDAYSGDTTTRKIYRYTGFTTTIASSISVSAIGTVGPRGLSRDTPTSDTIFNATSGGLDKLVRLTGFTTTVNDSFSTNAIITPGVEMHGLTGPMLTSPTFDKIYQMTNFTSTIAQSVSINPPSTRPEGVTYDGLHTIVIDRDTDSVYKFQHFTGTLIDSFSVAAVDTEPQDVWAALQDWDVSNAIEFSQLAIAEIIQPASNAIEFSQTAVQTKVASETVAQTVELSDVVVGSNMNQVVDQQVDFADAVTEFGIFVEAFNTVSFAEEVTPGVFYLIVEDTVTFADETHRTYEETIAQTVEFSQEAISFPTENTLEFSQLAEGSVAQPVLENLEFVQEIGLNTVLNLTIEDTISFRQSPQYTLPALEMHYNPINVGPEVGCLEHPADSLTLTKESFIKFTFGSEEILLRNPAFGNIDTMGPRRIFRRTRGNQPKAYKACIWPVDLTFKFSFSDLDRRAMELLQAFLRLTLGKNVSLTDHEGRVWNGIILNPDSALKWQRDDRWGADIVFTGEDGHQVLFARARNDLAFIEELLEGNKVSEGLEFSQVVSVNHIAARTINQTVEFSDVANLTHEIVVNQTIEFSDQGNLEHDLAVADIVEFSDTAEVFDENFPATLDAGARWYLMDEGLGTNVADSSIHGDDGTFGFPVPLWTGTPSIDFVDATREVILAAGMDGLFNGEWTVLIVCKENSAGKLISSGTGGGNYCQMSLVSGKLQIGTEDGAGRFWIEDTTNSVPAAAWYSVAGVMSVSGGLFDTLDGYIGGVAETMVTVFKSSPLPVPPAAGIQTTFSDNNWHGSVTGFSGEMALGILIPGFAASAADISDLHAWAAVILASRGISI